MEKIDGWGGITLSLAERLESVTGETEIERDVKTLAILNGVDESELWELTVEDIGRLTAEMSWMFESPVPEPFDSVEYGEVTLGPCLSMDRMSYRQYADLNAALVTNDRVEVMASCLAPVGGTYGKGYDIEGLKDYIRETVTIPQYNFFFQHCTLILLRLAKDLVTSWETMARTMTNTEEEGLTRQDG